MAFLCWAEHHEDLSRNVVAALAEGPIVVAMMTGEAAKERPWRVVVTCSANHASAFAGRGAVTDQMAHGMPDLVGVSPTAVDLLLQKTATTLSPGESLGRIEATAKYFIGLVATVSTLTTAFGAWSPTAAAHPMIALATSVLAALSVVAGLVALTPRRADVQVANLNDVRDHFGRIVSARACWLAVCGVCLALALVSAPFVKYLGPHPPPKPPAASPAPH